jgi:hypothetical protein
MRAAVDSNQRTGGIALSATLAAVLGAGFGLFVSGYWLIDLLPASSRQIVLITAAIALAAGFLYFLLLRWIWREVRGLSVRTLMLLALSSLVLGLFLFFAGTQQWRMSGRYVGFLLPRHQLQVSAPSAPPGSTRLIWFNSSIGDVSFGDLQTKGWSRQGDALVLMTLKENSIRWAGITGDRIQMVLGADTAGAKVIISWDGRDEAVTLDRGKTSYSRDFAVPYQASRSAIILLGLVNAFVLSLALALVVRKRQPVWQPALMQSATGKGGRLDRRDVPALIGVLTLALLLRVFNLANVFPAVDEYYHLIAAQQILQGMDLGAVYQRSLWIVTLPIALALRVFGHQVWAARLAGVVFSVLAVVPLYLIMRKVNRPTAIVTCALYACSPWIVTFSRMAREYAFYPFYFYWIAYMMVMFVEAVPAGFVVTRDWRAVPKFRLLALAAFLALPPLFGLVVDWLSTFRTVLIAYVVLGILVLTRFDWSDAHNWPILSVLLGAVAISGRAWYAEQSSKLLIWPRLNPVPLEYFFPNPQQQWYFERAAILIALAVVAAIGYAYVSRRITVVPSFMVLLLLTYLGVFALFSKSFFHTRHLLTTELWYAAVTGLGLYAMWTLLQAVVPLGRILPRIAVGLCLGLATVNVGQILLPSVSTNPDMPISEDYLHDMSKVQAYMVGRVQPGDVLVSTVYGLYALWEETPDFRAQYRITSTTPKEDLLNIVASNPSGWIVMDKIRLDLSAMSTRDFSELGPVDYVGTFGDEFVWHWQHPPG